MSLVFLKKTTISLDHTVSPLFSGTFLNIKQTSLTSLTFRDLAFIST